MIDNLSQTINGMVSPDYKERFIAEYYQVKIRHDRLKNYCDRIEHAQWSGEEEPPHECSLETLREQQDVMEEYMMILENRAIIENIKLI